MAFTAIAVGTTANDGTGDSPRAAGIKINDNFTDAQNQIDALPTTSEVNAAIAAAVEAIEGGGYSGTRSTSSTGNITSADAGTLVEVSGSSITLTLQSASWTALQSVDIINTGTADVTISAGTDGINRSGNNSFPLPPDQLVKIIYKQGTAPKWRAEYEDSTTLAANQYLASNSGGTAAEVRSDKRPFPWTAAITADGTYPVALWGDIPATLSQVRARTVSGTCSIQLRKGGAAFNGFSSAVALTTTVVGVTSTETLAEDNYIDIVVSSAASLTGIVLSFREVRTGN